MDFISLIADFFNSLELVYKVLIIAGACLLVAFVVVLCCVVGHKRKKKEKRAIEEKREKNKKAYTGNRQDLISQGYQPCHICNP